MIDRIGPTPAPPPEPAELVPPSARALGPRAFAELVAHLVRREIDAAHRMTVLGWGWPLARQLLQLVTLVFIFGSVIDLHIPHFPVYVFSGLVAWTWFSTGTAGAATSLLDQRHLVFQPRFPSIVLPIVAVVVPLVDVALALPVLMVLVIGEGGLHWGVVLVPALVVLQLCLMCGVAWLVSAISVFSRDVPNIVLVLLQVIFYMSPVFYRLHSVPSKYVTILDLNPLTTLIDGYRAALLGDPVPSAARFMYVAVLSAALIAGGLLVFRRQAPAFVDNL